MVINWEQLGAGLFGAGTRAHSARSRCFNNITRGERLPWQLWRKYHIGTYTACITITTTVRVYLPTVTVTNGERKKQI